MRTQGGFFCACAAVFAGAIAACAGKSAAPPAGNNPTCVDQGVAQLPAPPPKDKPLRGTVTVRDRIDDTINAAGMPTNASIGLAQADFGDYSAVTSTPAAVMDLTSGCVGVISRPLISGMAKPLNLESLTLKDTAKGDLLAKSSTTGVYSVTSSDPLMRDKTTVHIVGAGGGTREFPSFDVMMPAVSPIEASEPASDGTAELRDAELYLTWQMGQSDFVEIQITPIYKDASMSKGGQVGCFVPDNGCFAVPHDATKFLLASRTNTYMVSLERHRHMSVAVNPSADLELETVAEYRLTLKNGVLAP